WRCRLRGRGRAGGAGQGDGGGPRRGQVVTRAVALVRRAADVALVRAAGGLDPTAEVTAIAVGPEAEVTPVLTAAGAAGARQLVRLWDPGLETTDYLGVAYTLAAAVKALGDPVATPTVLLAGDRGRGVVGPAVAER